MLAEFNTRFGTGADGTVATENLMEGPRRRPKGMHMLQLMASFLDPRMKGGLGISDIDMEYIWDEIKAHLIQVALGIAADIIEPPEAIAAQEAPLLQQQQPEHFAHDHDDIFDKIDLHFEEANNQRLHNNNINNNNNNNNNNAELKRQRCIAAAEAELTLYKMEPAIRLRDAKRRFLCPLTWWRLNETKYKLLAVLAARILCIPATSAPSERVFSAAGLTIAKDRARLSPENASELVFLHDAEPAIKKYEEAQRRPL
jgi:hypothetical protein